LSNRGAIDERNDAPTTPRAGELCAERAAASRGAAHLLDLGRRDEETREEHLVQIEELTDSLPIAVFDRQARVLHERMDRFERPSCGLRSPLEETGDG